MTRSTLISSIIGFTLLGLLDAAYLAETALTGGQLACDIEGLSGCNVVAQSSYSHILGIPLGVYGVVFYVLVLILGILVLKRGTRLLDRLLAAAALIGVAASAWFVYIQVVLIQAFCIYCLGSAVIAVLLGGAALLLLRVPQAPSPSLPPTA